MGDAWEQAPAGEGRGGGGVARVTAAVTRSESGGRMTRMAWTTRITRVRGIAIETPPTPTPPHPTHPHSFLLPPPPPFLSPASPPPFPSSRPSFHPTASAAVRPGRRAGEPGTNGGRGRGRLAWEVRDREGGRKRRRLRRWGSHRLAEHRIAQAVVAAGATPFLPRLPHICVLSTILSGAVVAAGAWCWGRGSGKLSIPSPSRRLGFGHHEPLCTDQEGRSDVP
jgi:hypothetical protein